VGHALTGWSIEKIKSDDRVRRIVKALHFGIIYGLKAPGLVAHLAAQGIKVTIDEMEKYRQRYFKRFSGVAEWLENQIALTEELGYTLDIFGQKRPVNVEEQKYMGDEYEGAFWENQAVNTPVQGGAHKMMLISVAALHRKPEEYDQLQHPQLEIHDALYFDTQLKNMWKAYEQGKPLLEKEPVDSVRKDFEFDWTVPLKAEASAGFRHGVKVKDLGEGKMTTTSAFLNKWCQKNRELGLKLQAELKKVA
jgi:DNA polymerase I